MLGKVFKILKEDSKQKTLLNSSNFLYSYFWIREVYISFGGLITLVKGDYEKMTGF